MLWKVRADGNRSVSVIQSSRGDEGQRRAVNPYPVVTKWHVSKLELAAGLHVLALIQTISNSGSQL
jgi:hypothetical protein